MTASERVRRSGSYAEIDGRAYRAASDVEGGRVTLFWRDGEGPPPEADFEFNADRSGASRSGVDVAEIERYYRLRTTCSYRGGGPFEVIEYPKDRSLVWLAFRGEDVQWASTLPRMSADFSGLLSYRVPEAVGLVPVGELTDVCEAQDVVRLPRRRRPRGQAERTRG